MNNWKDLIDTLPLVTLATGELRVDWKGLINLTLTGVVSGIIASQIMVIRLEEKVIELSRRIENCEKDITTHTVFTSAELTSMRERMATCEARLHQSKEH